MGKVTGFLEYERTAPVKQDAKARLEHYNEFVVAFEQDQVKQEAARCMDCGVPFCQSGCPLGNVIPEFNEAVYKAEWEIAANILLSTNNFPEFTGRICPAPCESACVLGINKSPVSIEDIEKHIIEIAFSKGYIKAEPPLIRSGKKVAVIGSGPAGLAAAAQLNKAGHEVVVYERDDTPGGLLNYGIPDFKLQKDIVTRRISLMEKEGIEFKCNANVGVNVELNTLLREYQSIVLAGGSTIPRDLNVTGRAAKGVHYAMDFLKQQNKRVRNFSIDQEPVLATGKDVIVIGGGDTGSDCIGTSNRQGAKSVTQFEIMPMPAQQRTENMPWPTYPMLLKVTSSHEEGCSRAWGVNTKEFIADENGALKALKVVDVEWEIDATGRPVNFKEIEGTTRELPCQLVLLAMGFLYPQKEGLIEKLGIELDNRGNVKAEEGKYQTNIAKVFVAGDMRRGQSLVVWAISEGREAARKVDEYLMGSSKLATKDGIPYA
ncbi:glutamate synthase (NADPH/NADH) small chain [Pedobacter cryoconitis]|uniref:Glutamate synthase (NADPH/NADH) small chain n=1 Tax=Pedobacter cryoconitis TaxID=188932 RepID=A0A7W8ZPZ4_9SPHI|nr:glutamate synthase subunit beta [Pedobacter cryoconitis]MBB5638036.1 glutamate synthase (NADPH/NADH) small chain [Pedobacter cryoconitis]MBB6270979.1 glutamate synthase (NADPH/NADH) small chain [Pedobacter cryoconitis]